MSSSASSYAPPKPNELDLDLTPEQQQRLVLEGYRPGCDVQLSYGMKGFTADLKPRLYVTRIAHDRLLCKKCRAAASHAAPR